MSLLRNHCASARRQTDRDRKGLHGIGFEGRQNLNLASLPSRPRHLSGGLFVAKVHHHARLSGLIHSLKYRVPRVRASLDFRTESIAKSPEEEDILVLGADANQF